jgi:hypothetical protein
MTKMKTDLLGPYAEPREWLLQYMKTARFTNPQIVAALQADWTGYCREKAAYVVGAAWGRCRQNDTALENASEYAQLVQAEFVGVEILPDKEN